MTVDDGEIHEHQWIRPAEAHRATRRGRDRDHPAHVDHAAARSTEESTVDATLRGGRATATRRSTARTSPTSTAASLDLAGRRRRTRTATPPSPGPQPPADARRRLARRNLLTRRRQAGTGALIARGPPRSLTDSGHPPEVLALSPMRSPQRSRITRWLNGPDLRWGRRLVVAVTAVALLAVACGGGDDSDQAQSATTAPEPSEPPPSRRRPPTEPKKIDTIPGMPGVPDPSNLYSETASGKMSDAVNGALTRVYVPNRAANTVSVIDPATMQVVDTFDVGLNPQHVVPSWDLKTLWVTNNAEGTPDGTLTPVDPKTGRPGAVGGRRRPLQHVLLARRQVGDQRRRSPQAPRLPRPADHGVAGLARRPGMRRNQPRRLLHRRPLRDLHLRVPGQPREDRHRQPLGRRLPAPHARAACPRTSARRPTAAPSSSPR